MAPFTGVASAAQAPALTVVSTGPQGELKSREDGNEIRIVFSEPMVELGKIPDTVTAPFVRIAPAVAGTFRWSGTTILIFTPAKPLPFSTRYEVTVNPTATAVSGRKLAKPVTFRFTTPTVVLQQTHWYRRGGTVNGRMVIVLTFNQPVRAADVAASLTANLEPHPWTPPSFSPEQLARLKTVDPTALEQFERKVQATRLTAASKDPIALRPTTDWDRKQFPPSPRLAVFETVAPVPPEGWVKLTLGRTMKSIGGNATPSRVQSFTIEGDPAFFVRRFACSTECDPEYRNAIELTAEVDVKTAAPAISVYDITTEKTQPLARATKPRPRQDYELDKTNEITIEDAGYESPRPNRKYAATVKADMKSADGQTLGYTWVGVVDNWHNRAFTSFGDGHGVWEKDGGAVLPFYARNLTNVTQWVSRLRPSELMATILKLQPNGFRHTPAGPGTPRRLQVTPDRVQSHGLDLTKNLDAGGTGIVWAAVREGTPIARSKNYGRDGEVLTKASIVQVTNLGLTVKDSPQNTLVFVTRLDNGTPVAGARVSIVRTDNSTQWTGTTGADGVAIAPSTPLRDPDDWWQFSFIVTAEKDGDVAYVGSDWNEGISPWEFGTGVDLSEATPLLRGTVFSDRGVYRLGEEVHFKAILRHNAPGGIGLLPANSGVIITVRDSRNKVVDERTVRVNNWSSAEWTMTLPADGTLGNYSVRALLESDRPKPRQADAQQRGRREIDSDDDWRLHRKAVHSSFLVAAYRRPDFRVDVTLGPTTPVAGDALKGVVTARYLFGASIGERPITWKYESSPSWGAPAAITDRFPDERWVFVGEIDDEALLQSKVIGSAEAKLTAEGQLALDLQTEKEAGIPRVYRLEGDVEDVSRQHIANRATVVVHPAPFYVGVRKPPYFLDQKNGLKTEIVAAGIDGRPVSGVPVNVTLTQIQWTSVRRAEGNGFYTWETERKEVPSGSWTVTTAGEPVPLEIPLKQGGYFVLRARGEGSDRRFAVTTTSFYVIGEGYTAWERFDHNRIQLVPERQTWKPGDTARIMVQSPWERATALVTTEREGIRSHRQFALTSTQSSISIPITEADIPNVFVSVVLLKGRTDAPPTGAAVIADDKTAEDPGKPAFRIGYTELRVEDRSKRLSVAVAADKEEFRPASTAKVRVDVKDQQGRGAPSEVTLWAVDYGVLSLTSYRTPDVLGSVYVRKALQVLNSDSRQRIISRRVLTPKGETEGGGGGADPGAGTLRKDFRVLAFWLGSVATGPDGTANVDVKLPESLTTYRIMAVAGDRSSRFGSGDAEVRTNKPLTLKPTFPRFLAVGDRAYFGAVVGTQLKTGGAATVTMKSLDPNVLSFTGAGRGAGGPADEIAQQVTLTPGGNLEVRFEGTGRSIGRARVQMTVRSGNESDAFEDTIPVEVMLTPETVAAYGEARDKPAVEKLTAPAGIVPGFGGLNIELASTALVGLGEGARYLVEYPYGCAEQKASKVQALMLAADLGEAFALPGVDAAKARPIVQQTLRELERFQCDSGGFAYWPGACETTSPYLTAYLLDIMKTASDLKYDVDRGARERAYTYLQEQLKAAPPNNAAWRPAYTAWQAFAVKVLTEGGRNQDSNLNRLYTYRDHMPMFALAFFHDALVAKKETGVRLTEVRRRLMNATLPEGGMAHVTEVDDPYLAWFWSSNVRSTAIVLNSFVKADAKETPITPMVRWLMNARTNGRWGNTQENSYAMTALVNYYRRYEPEAPAFRAIASLGGQELAASEFKGRSTTAVKASVPIAQVAAAADTSKPLTFTREGTGTLFYNARLRYAVDRTFQQAHDAGMKIERRYEPFVENGKRAAATAYQAGDLVRVTLTFTLTKERRFVAVTDPLPAGFEAVESWFNTTAQSLAQAQDRQRAERGDRQLTDWENWWTLGGFDHVERHDDRVELFATRLSVGTHEFSYIARATTAGTFKTAPARAEEMYTPEIFGRTPTTMIEVKR